MKTLEPLSLYKWVIPAVIFALNAGSSSAFATTRYVDNSGSPACSNNQSLGSQSQPWCTISYGINNLNSGDELIVKQGVYNEDIYINGPAGTAAKPTVIRTFPGHAVTIRGFGNTGRVKITTTSYIVFDGFEITNFNQGIFVEGASTNITIRNCIVHDVGQEGIHVRENSSYVTVQGCTIFNTERMGGCCNGEGIYIGTSSSGPLDNTHHITISDNLIHDTTDEGIELKPGTHDCIVDGNTLYNVDTAFGATGGGAIEVNQRDVSPQTWSGNPDHIIRNNVVHHSTTAIRLGTGATAYNNVIYSPIPGRYGIYVDNLNGDNFTRRVYHNTIHMASNAVVIGGGATIVRNNIGPTTPGNLAFDSTFFVNAAMNDYHLVAGSSPVNAGIDLAGAVPVDKDGNVRPLGPFPDLGAFEYGQFSLLPSAPQNLRIVSSP